MFLARHQLFDGTVAPLRLMMTLSPIEYNKFALSEFRRMRYCRRYRMKGVRLWLGLFLHALDVGASRWSSGFGSVDFVTLAMAVVQDIWRIVIARRTKSLGVWSGVRVVGTWTRYSCLDSSVSGELHCVSVWTLQRCRRGGQSWLCLIFRSKSFYAVAGAPLCPYGVLPAACRNWRALQCAISAFRAWLLSWSCKGRVHWDNVVMMITCSTTRCSPSVFGDSLAM